jgi:hypothetical protein
LIPFLALILGYAISVANYRVAVQYAAFVLAAAVFLILLPLRWKIVLSDRTLTYRA